MASCAECAIARLAQEVEAGMVTRVVVSASYLSADDAEPAVAAAGSAITEIINAGLGVSDVNNYWHCIASW